MRIGIDIQDASRFEKLVGTKKMQKMFTKSELSYIGSKNNSLDTIAGLYCAKEAFFKALGTGILHNQLCKVEVLHDVAGAPYINTDLTDKPITLSISHTKQTAVAVCIIG